MKNIVKNNTALIIRIILSLVFLGHGLVSLGLSPSYSLHYSLVDGVNFTNIPTYKIVEFQGWVDILISLFLIIRCKLNIILYIILIYLSVVCISALVLYSNTTGSFFGISECFRRFPWLFLSLFLLLDLKGVKKYHLIRIGLSFAFISHGFASLGFLGLNQGHIDLAIKLVSEENARFFVSCTGITDSIIGLLLLRGLYTRYVSILSILWITFIVYISFLSAIPDGIFRLGFLLLAIYICFDKRTYTPKLFNYEKK